MSPGAGGEVTFLEQKQESKAITITSAGPVVLLCLYFSHSSMLEFGGGQPGQTIKKQSVRMCLRIRAAEYIFVPGINRPLYIPEKKRKAVLV